MIDKEKKRMAKNVQDASSDKINRNIKDSVFCDLFGKPEYLFQLYKVLHPEDTESQADDLTIITLSKAISRVMYNDLGFIVGNRLLVLVEAQSTWSENILVRFLMYLGETYRRYIDVNGLDIYHEKKIELPAPELYVIYTGDSEDKPQHISLKESFFRSVNSCVDVEARIIFDSRHGDIIDQYITFCKIFNRQRALYPNDRQMAVLETIRICKEENALREYLKGEEAAAVMCTIYDQEKALQIALKDERDEGKGEGLDLGIVAFDNIGDMIEAGKNNIEIKSSLIDDLGLSEKQAEGYLHSFMKRYSRQ